MEKQIVWTPRQSAPKAFPERQALMPIWGGIPIPRPQWQNIWRQKLPHAADSDALAYLHIPFCANHCVFCGFYRNAWKESYSSVYTDKIIEENGGGKPKSAKATAKSAPSISAAARPPRF